MELLKMSLSAALLIVVIVIIRALAINKLPKKTFLVLWGVVLCKLLIPFSLPSQLSFYTLVNAIQGIFADTQSITASPYMVNIPETGMDYTNVVPIASNVSITPMLLLTMVWFAGTLACALFFVVVHLRCRREYKMALPIENSFIRTWLYGHSIKRKIKVKQSDKILSPMTYGIFTPVILLPKTMDWNNLTQLDYVLMHEFVHIRQFDIFIKWLLVMVACVHWFNPFVWLMYMLSNRDIELSCDETVVHSFGETTKSAYALALIGLEERKNRFSPLCNSFSKNAIEERIRSIMTIKKTSFLGLSMACVLVLGVTTAFASSAASSQNDNISTATGTIMGHTDITTGTKMVSEDNGATWMTEEEYNQATPVVVWWTYDEYKSWLEQEKSDLQSTIGGKAWNPSDGWFVWTQEKVDETIRMYEQTLEDIKNGLKVSKTVDGKDDIVMVGYIGEASVSTSHGLTIANEKGIMKSFDYDSREQLIEAVTAYVNEQVKAGSMTQEEAEKLISQCQ